MRKKIAAGNWKMHKTLQEAEQTASALEAGITNDPACEVWIAPPAPYLATLAATFKKMTWGSQDLSQHDSGAFTGEWSSEMLHSCGAGFSLIAHSERRQYHREDDVLAHQKILAALRHELTAVYCCGEHLSDREANDHFRIVENQIREALLALSHDAMGHVVIAYEPVWAIGTGVTATTEQAGEMHRFIRSTLADMFGDHIAASARILYGGSVKPGNAAELFSDPDIDGGLVGGASLQADDFLAIIQAASAS
ncbi:MAG: triose-phosphate isomerase [Chitinophagales bacterium]|nr:triose-phosphate isomerase [Chitinophagales bacterium]HAE14311.1 triose-phosphate isomerase [Bacteroidota bacterium]MCB9019185.1 triose-phosphate isomerase [Chitinophagales bacterium]MCB9021801.1 triose-phosphate isomerase [Chitinophagales bacterium]MCB9030948.1 triose-phosphate isomerase [Chitinophagales bacterium]